MSAHVRDMQVIVVRTVPMRGRLSQAPRSNQVEREVGDGSGGVVGDEMRCVVDVGELDAIGVPLRIAADMPQDLLGPGVVRRPYTTRVGTVSRRRR